MRKFKLGDKVRLRKDVVVGNSYSNVTLWDYIYKDFKNSCLEIKNLGKYDAPLVASELGKSWYVGEDALELYQEDCSYKIGDTLIIDCYKGFIDEDCVGYFLNLKSQFLTHYENCDKLKELFGKDIFTSIAHKHNAINFVGEFPDFRSIEDLVTFVNALNKLLDSKKESDLTTTKNYQNNEIKFQRTKASCKRGIVPAGSTICGRKDKIAISIGHLSYQVCNC